MRGLDDLVAAGKVNHAALSVHAAGYLVLNPDQTPTADAEVTRQAG
jgi:hypothetical protein